MGEEIIRIDLDGVNSYLVKSNDCFVLFDTGGPLFKDKYFTDRRDELQRELDKAGCNQDNLKLLVLTHGDLAVSYTHLTLTPDGANTTSTLLSRRAGTTTLYRTVLNKLAAAPVRIVPGLWIR